MTQQPVRTSRSALRPMVVGAAALALVVAIAGTVLACWGPHAVADAVAENSRQRAVIQAVETAHTAAAGGAVHIGGLMDRARASALRISGVARTERASHEACRIGDLALEPLGSTGVSWRPPDDDGTYLVPTDPDPEVVARLAAVAHRIAPHLVAIVEGDDGVVHAAAWFEGLGLVGAAPPAASQKLAARESSLGFGRYGLAGGDPLVRSGWLPPGERLAGERVVSYAVPLLADDDPSHIVAVVAVDASCAAIEGTLRRHTQYRGASGALLAATGEVIASTSDLAERLGVESRDGSVVGALRGLVGAGVLARAPESARDFALERGIVTVAGVPATGWTVVALMPPASRIAAFTDGAVGAEEAARRQALGFVVLSILFGFAIALGAFALADSFRKRLRPILEGAAAHARGELDHVIDAPDDDELGDLAASLDATATRLRQNIGRLEESERRLLNLIETMAEGFLVVDVDDRATFVNRRFTAIVDRPPSTVLAKSVEDLLSPESLERWRAESEWRRRGRSTQFEASWRTTRGRPARAIVSATPMLDAKGAYAGCSLVVTDVTDRLGDEEERARADKLRALGEMAGGIAHDFNNLLTVMLGNAQLLLMEELPASAKSTIGAIEEAAIECGERVGRITEFSKPRRLGPDAHDVDPNVVITEALVVAKAKRAGDATRRGAQYAVDERRSARRVVRGDVRELRNAVVHLLDNAFEAMEHGGRLIVEAVDVGEDAVGIRVEDTGVGMDEFVRAKAFEPFFSTKHLGRCAGLGLPIVYEIVKAHGGHVEVRSAHGKGAAFTIILPARRSGARPRSDAPDAAPAAPRVLLVGVSESESMQSGLRALGVHVAAVGPQSAHAVLADAGIFNTLVVELGVGPSAVDDLVLSARAGRADLRILLLVPNGRRVTEHEAQSLGVDRALALPIDVRELRVAIFSCLAAAPATRVAAEDAGGGPDATDTQGAAVDVWGGPESQAQAAGDAIPMGNA